MKYEISDEIKNNIFVFLNRVKFEGLSEVQAISEIIATFNKPLVDEEK